MAILLVHFLMAASACWQDSTKVCSNGIETEFAQFKGAPEATYGILYGTTPESASTSVWHFGIAGNGAGRLARSSYGTVGNEVGLLEEVA